MEKPPNDGNVGELEEFFAQAVREAEQASPKIPVATEAAKLLSVAPSRYKGPPKLVLIQGGLSSQRKKS